MYAETPSSIASCHNNSHILHYDSLCARVGVTLTFFSILSAPSRLYYHNVIPAKFIIGRNNSKEASVSLFIGLASLDLDSNCGRHDVSIGAKIRAS